MTANRRTTVLIVSAVVFTMLLGGIAFAQQSAPAQTMETAAAAGTVTMADIDNALASGPVFVEFESQECTYCKQQRPISEALASDYTGKVTFFFVDVAQSRDLARSFQVSGVPQINVIAQKSGEQYTYVTKDGTASNSIAGSKFLGLTQKDALKTAIDAGVRMRGQ
jgi:thiol-disulfide isomerase/thioredoxin